MTITLLLLALKSLLVAAATLALLHLTRTRSAAERSTIAHLGLFALVALPLGSLALPTLALPVPAPVARLAAIDSSGTPVLSAPISNQTTAPNRADAAPAEAAKPPTTSNLFAAIAGAGRYIFLLPTLLLLALTLVALLRLVGLRRRADVLVDPVWLTALARAQHRMGFKNGTALLRSDELGSPVSWGLMRPIILLNDAAVRAPDQAEAIIAHELAHVVHFDWAKLILARVATAAFWFNPLAWVLAREAHQLREEAADDAVLAADIAGPDYAELLIGVARHQCRGALLGAHGVAPSKSSLGRRVRRVLDQSPARRMPGRSWIAGFATGMLSMAVPLAALTIVPGRSAPVGVQTVSQPVVQHSDQMPHAEQHLAARAATDPAPMVATGRDTPRAPSVAVEADAASPPADDDRTRSTAQADQDDVSEAALHIGGYRRAMANAGFPNLSTGQLAEARAGDVSPTFARAMRATGMALSLDDMVEARAMGLSPGYIAAMRGFGINGSLDDYKGMQSVGVTASFVRKLRARGITTISPEKLTELRAAGGDPGPDSDP